MTAVHLQGMLLALVFLLAANGAPILMNALLGKRLAWPMDSGVTLPDGYRLFGGAKTWRGLFSAVCATTGLALVCARPPLLGLIFGFLAMTGDLLASFCKRRLGHAESSHARGLDTVPESVLPIAILKEPLALNLIDIILVAVIFFLIEEFVSPLLYRWHIRNKPY